MYFKAKFVEVIDEDFPSTIQLGFDSYTGKEILIFDGHEFEVERANYGRIVEMTFCNQCVNTYNIEETFLRLLFEILQNNETVILIDSNGMEDEMNKAGLEEMMNNF